MGFRTWLLRRAMGRLRLDDDIVRHLSTFQRLGETVEVQLPAELLPVGARTVFRALRTRAASQISAGWVWPWWMERQNDPSAAAFVPRGHLPFLTNLTHRNWTAVGNVGSVWEAVVDPRGLVTPWFDGWSLDWWVGADDRWHLPSREAGVRQRLVDAAPMVETALRVPGGDVVHRAYAARASPADGGDELVVVEVENRSPAPVAVAFAVRPYNPEGLAVIERIGLHEATVTVDGRVAVLLPRPPSRVAASTFAEGDSAEAVLGGRAGTAFPERLRCEASMASAAFLYPLPHTATIRLALPLPPARRTRRPGVTRRRVARAASLPAVPSAGQVAAGWAAHARRGMRLVLPDQRLAEAVEANRRYLLLLHDGDEITPGPSTYHRFWFRDAAFLVTALDRCGFAAEAAEVLGSYPDRQRVDGFFFSQRQEWDANGAALHALAEHWRLTGDSAFAEAMAGPVAKACHWIERKRRSRRRRADPALRGLLPAGISAEHLGPFDYFYWDDFWALRGLLDGAELLRAAGQPDAAADAERFAAGLRADLAASLAATAARLGTAAVPAGPRRRIDSGAIGSLAACWPLLLLPPDDPAMVATADVVRERFCLGDAFYQAISHSGLGTYLTLQLAFVELLAGDRRAWARLGWLLGAATPTWTWPEAIHPRLAGGCMGDGHHGWAAADFLTFVRTALVREVPACWPLSSSAGSAAGNGAGPGLALCSLVPDAWLGQPIEVHDAPTHAGRLSFAVRWHGERPALLWELVPHAAAPARPVALTAPGLDPRWSASEPAGEALLGAVRAPR